MSNQPLLIRLRLSLRDIFNKESQQPAFARLFKGRLKMKRVLLSLALSIVFISCSQPSLPTGVEPPIATGMEPSIVPDVEPPNPTVPEAAQPVPSVPSEYLGSNTWRYKYESQSFITLIMRGIRTVRGDYHPDEGITTFITIDSLTRIDSIYNSELKTVEIKTTAVRDTFYDTLDVRTNSGSQPFDRVPVIFRGNESCGATVLYNQRTYPCTLNRIASWSYWVDGIGLISYAFAHTMQKMTMELISFNGLDVTLVITTQVRPRVSH
jgi:hypothetical protein